MSSPGHPPQVAPRDVPDGRDPARLRTVVAILCATEVTSWGVLFYAFPVLATSIRDAEGWSLTQLVAAFTVAQLVGAGCGIWVGRHIDRHGPRRVMTAGSALGVVAVVLVASAPTLPLFFAAWVLMGAAMSATLYPPAFAALTGWAGSDAVTRVRALTAVTLVAGFASTVFAPLSAVLLDQLGWRHAYVVLAVFVAACVPAHWWGLSRPWTRTDHGRDLPDEASVADPVPNPPAGSSPWNARDFALLTAGMTLAGFCVYAVVVNLVPLLTENGLSTSEAAVALGIGGAGQVAGRLIYGPVMTRLGPGGRTLATLLVVTATTAALATVHTPLGVVIAISFLAGSARGIFTLIQATAVVDRWGTARIGSRNAILTGGITAASAFAPWVGALLAAGLGSFADAFLVLAAGTLAAVLLLRRT